LYIDLDEDGDKKIDAEISEGSDDVVRVVWLEPAILAAGGSPTNYYFDEEVEKVNVLEEEKKRKAQWVAKLAVDMEQSRQLQKAYEDGEVIRLKQEKALKIAKKLENKLEKKNRNALKIERLKKEEDKVMAVVSNSNVFKKSDKKQSDKKKSDKKKSDKKNNKHLFEDPRNVQHGKKFDWKIFDFK